LKFTRTRTRTRITIATTVGLLLPGAFTLAAAPSAKAAPSSGVLSQVTTPGRVAVVGDAVQYTWPGVYFEGRFRGTGIGISLNDSNNDYVVQVDGKTVANLVTPGKVTYWVNNLASGDHTTRIAKRTESPWAAG
jgi:hypothetical protein